MCCAVATKTSSNVSKSNVANKALSLIALSVANLASVLNFGDKRRMVQTQILIAKLLLVNVPLLSTVSEKYCEQYFSLSIIAKPIDMRQHLLIYTLGMRQHTNKARTALHIHLSNVIAK